MKIKGQERRADMLLELLKDAPFSSTENMEEWLLWRYLLHTLQDVNNNQLKKASSCIESAQAYLKKVIVLTREEEEKQAEQKEPSAPTLPQAEERPPSMEDYPDDNTPTEQEYPKLIE